MNILDDELKVAESNEQQDVNKDILSKDKEVQSEIELKEADTSQEKDVSINLSNFGYVLTLIKTWFSKRPLNAFRRLLSLKESLVLFAIHLVVTSISMLLMFNSFLSIISNLSFGFIPVEGLSGRFFLPIVFSTLIYYALLTLTVMIVAKIIKSEHSSYVDSMSVVSISLIPITCLGLLSAILGFISPLLLYVISMVSLLLFPITLYLGIQINLGKPKKSPYWILPIALIILACVLAIILFYSVFSTLNRMMFDMQNTNPFDFPQNNLFR